MAKSEDAKPVATSDVPPTETPPGPLNRLLLMDNTQWLPGERCQLPNLTRGIERAGRLTNRHYLVEGGGVC